MPNTIQARIRTEIGKSKVRKIRRAGELPAVMYGHGDTSMSLSISAHQFSKLLKDLRGQAPIVELEIEQHGKFSCVIKAIQRNPIDGSFMSVDFQKVHPNERITMNVPVILTGVAIGVKEGGILEQILREIPVRATIDKIPQHFEIDITNLKIGHSIHISDLRYPEIEFTIPLESPIVTILSPRKITAAVEVPVTAEAPTEPEVIKEKKAVEESTGSEKEEKGKPTGEEKKKEEKKH